jgi:hypothetical protein
MEEKTTEKMSSEKPLSPAAMILMAPKTAS